ncbi:hypothetical protein FRC12_016311 [Ceratobasidium sp. 428]|nr:hypothetical protein FRC12_016311 [Ceratobasidium sp. 428]
MSFGGSLVISGNKLSGSSFNDRIQEPHKLNFPDLKVSSRGDNQPGYYDWPDLCWPSPPGGSTAEWYQSQPTTKFTSIQHRTERTGPFFHEFIVVELENDTVCRFDCRGDPMTRANAFTTEGITAEDTAHVIQKHESHYNEIYNTSNLLLQINFPESQDLQAIMRACYGIHKCEATRSYTLLKHNCYFFAWTIIAALLGLDLTPFNLHKLRRNKLANQKSSLVNRVMVKTSAAFKAPISDGPRQSPDRSSLVITIDSEYRHNKDSDVYLYIESRIREHCKHLRTFGIFLSPRTFEDTMWEILGRKLRMSEAGKKTGRPGSVSGHFPQVAGSGDSETRG